MFQTSPGIKVSELDLTASARTVSVSDAAFVGTFQWGPAFDIKSIATEDELVRTFGKPDENVFEHWFTAASFLAYSGLLRVARATSNTALNATADAKSLGTANGTSNSATWAANTTSIVAGQSLIIDDTAYTVNAVVNSTAFTTTEALAGANVVSGTLTAYGLNIKNETHYDDAYSAGAAGLGAWAGKWAGELGNSLKVSVCPSANAFVSSPTGGVSLTSGSNVVTGTTTSFTTECAVGDSLVIEGVNYGTISAITNTTSMQLATAASATVTAGNGSWARWWEFASYFDAAPGTSSYASTRGGSADEMHIVVVDEDGLFTGIPGTVLERYAFVSKGLDAKNANGENNYYVTVVNRRSSYVWWLGAPGSNTTSFGTSVVGTTFGADVTPETVSLTGGQSRNSAVVDGDLELGYDLFANADEVDISLVVTGPASAALASYVIQNICEVRADCIAFVSPTKASVVNNSGGEVDDITSHRNSLPSSSYAFLDSGWKYMYDKYNDRYRWVPLNGDTAGIAARSDASADPWFSPAGFSRGNVKNIIKLAWNPKQLDRDDLYKIGVNPVVSFPSQGVVLYGDKTLLDRPSAFDRINVRRLFIILEKTIARLARTQLFEFNDEFTRSQFRNIVEPYLRDVKARRGLIDYRVICDDSNNTPEVVEQNRFVGDIYVKPSRSINFIQLNFVAVRSGVSFQEVIGG